MYYLAFFSVWHKIMLTLQKQETQFAALFTPKGADELFIFK